jgi:multiple sugar transport system substrate-binding protein
MKKLFAMLLAVAMMTCLLAGCGSSGASSAAASGSAAASASASAAAASTSIPENEVTGDPTAENAFVIWGWNTDFVTILQNVLPKYLSEEELGRIVFVNAGGSDYYQDKIDEILADPSNDLYPDVMLLETGYVQKYVQSDYLQDVKTLGIEDADMANMYDCNIQLGTDTASGVTKALFWQATPGCLQIRADLAEKYLGTTDAAELQGMLDSWDKIVAVSKQVNEASGGKVKLLSGYDDMKYAFCNGARSEGWYDDNDTITVDDAMVDYMNVSKQLYEDDSTFNTNMWGTDWAALKDGDGESTEACIAFFGCPWYTYWCLTDTWSGNCILISGPQAFYWGGTGLGATTGCADNDLAAKVLRYTTCDTQAMIDINSANGDYVNNRDAIAYISANGSGTTSTFTCYNNQSIVDFFADKCDSINATLAKGEDQKICEVLLPAAVTAYANGTTDLDTTMANFKASIHDMYSYLNVG